MNTDSTHLEWWIQIWIEKYATGSELKSSCERGLVIIICIKFNYSSVKKKVDESCITKKLVMALL